MKTLHTIGAAIMIVLSTSAFADDKKMDSNKTKTTEKTIKAPEFVWGNPEDAVSIEATAKRTFELPSFVWGDPSDKVEAIASVPVKRIALPEFVWGDPSTEPTILTSIKLPEFVWGNPQDIELQDADI